MLSHGKRDIAIAILPVLPFVHHFDMLLECDGQTDRQTYEHADMDMLRQYGASMRV